MRDKFKSPTVKIQNPSVKKINYSQEGKKSAKRTMEKLKTLSLDDLIQGKRLSNPSNAWNFMEIAIILNFRIRIILIQIVYHKLNSEKFSISSLNCHVLRENHENDNFSDFYESTLHMTFAIFLKTTILIMSIFVKIFKNHI